MCVTVAVSCVESASSAAETVTVSAVSQTVSGDADTVTSVLFELMATVTVSVGSVSSTMVSRIPHLAQTSDAVNRQLSCFSSRYMNLLAVFQI